MSQPHLTLLSIALDLYLPPSRVLSLMSDHSGSDDDALLRAAAAQLAAKQQQKGKSAGRHQQVKSAGDTDEQNQPAEEARKEATPTATVRRGQ